MKIYIFIFLMGYAAAAGSGPYLPSGWRPEGPAFNLPGETEKPSQNLLKDQLFDVEPAGSDFLREYGPPKLEVSQDITLQSLPEVETEKPFLIVGKADLRADDAVVIENAEIKYNEAAAKSIIEDAQIIEDTTNIAQYTTDDAINETTFVKEEKTTDKKQNLINGEIKSEVNEIKQEVMSEVKAISETIKEDVARINNEVSKVKAEVNKVMEEVYNEEQIAEGNLRSEVKSQETQVVPELKSVQEQEISTQKLPEGFLEYSPPGFREYGPPKEDGNTLEQDKSLENNETRRRRFSPKFRATLNRRN